MRLVNLPDVVSLYSDSGSLTRQLLWTTGKTETSSLFSVFLMVGEPHAVMTLYLLSVLAGLSLMAGYKTRLSTLICWLFAISLYNRNPFINPASDTEMEMCLFFCIFCPWGGCWSLDNRGAAPNDPPAYTSAATVAWRMQVVALYMGAALAKNTSQWFDGTAVEIALFSDFWSSWRGNLVGDWASQFPGLLPATTEAVLWVEFFLPLGLLAPFWRVQVVTVLCFALMHATFGLCLNLETFTPVAIGLLSGFVPGPTWKWLQPLQRRLDSIFSGPAGELKMPALGPYSSAFVSWALLGMLWSNLDAVNCSPVRVSKRAYEPLLHFRLGQGWYMFVPPPFRGGWFLFRGQTLAGRWVNLLDGTAAEVVGPPRRTDEGLRSTRFYLLYSSRMLKSPGLEAYQQILAYNLRRAWERSHPDQTDRLVRVELHRFSRDYRPEIGGFTRPEHLILYAGPADRMP